MRTYFIDIIKNKKVFIFGQPCTYQGDHLGKGTPSVPCYLIFKISEIKMACFLLERDLCPPPPPAPRCQKCDNSEIQNFRGPTEVIS